MRGERVHEQRQKSDGNLLSPNPDPAPIVHFTELALRAVHDHDRHITRLNQKMMVNGAFQPWSLVWTDDEVELLGRVTLNYKTTIYRKNPALSQSSAAVFADLVHVPWLLRRRQVAVSPHLLCPLAEGLRQRAARHSSSGCSSLVLQARRHPGASATARLGPQATVHHLAVVHHGWAEAHRRGAVGSCHSTRRARFLGLRGRVVVGRALAQGALPERRPKLGAHAPRLGAGRVQHCPLDAGAVPPKELRKLLVLGGGVGDTGGRAPRTAYPGAPAAVRGHPAHQAEVASIGDQLIW